MNDADLEKLSVKPGKLEPKFDRDITEYNVTLPSIVTKISITPLTRDSDATWTIQGHGTVRNIPITQGEGKDVIIEVTAEDGSTKQYTIHFNSLSPSDASFKDIEISVGRLTPAFQTEILKYTAYVPWFVESVRTRTSSADKDMKGGNAEYDTILSYGETVQDLQVESVDKTNIRIYQISFIKERILRHINPVGEFNKSLICAICLGFVHCPNAIKTSEVNVAVGGPYFCKTCISPITKTRKIHPILEIPLPNDHLQPAYDLEEKVANLHVNCTYSSAGCIAELPLKELGKHMKDCGYRPIFLSRYDGVIPYREKDNVALVSTDSCTMCGHLVHTDEMTIHLKYYCPAKHANTRFKHVVKLRNWEKSLHDKVIGDDVDNAFFDSALELKMALCNYAKVTKMKPTKWENHFHLAMCFEEMHFAEDIHGLKLKDDDEGNGGDEMDKMMDLAGDKAKEEEIQAICKSRGISQDAPLSLQLKALDEEYHYLLEHGLSAKAEYVQTLYEWKSKQCIQVDVTSSNSSEGEYLGKAYLKYCDALACDPNNYQLHMHVGRHLLLQKDYDGAIVRLEAAVGLNPTNVDARFYLGLAYAKKFGRTFQRPGEIIRYLSSGIEFAMFKLQEDVEFDLPLCTADIFARLSNILLFEGMYELAHFMRDKSNCLVDKERKKIVELLTEASVLALHFMNGVSHRGYTYIQLKWAVVRVQYTLGLHLMTELKRQANMSQKELDEMQKYWERLSAITRAFELPCDKEVLAIERKICEEAVVLRPSCSQALYRLGDAQLLCYDNDPIGNPEMLREAEVSYRVSIELEGKPANDPSTHYDIVVTEWWKNKLEKDKMLKPTTAKAKHPEKKMTNTKPMHKNETSVKGKGTPGKNQTSTAAKTAGRGGTQSSKGQGAATVPPRQSSNVSSKNASTSNKGKASTSAATTAKASPTKTASHRHGSKQTEIPSTSSRHHGKTSPTKAPEKKESVKSVENKENKQLSKETKEETTVSSTQELNKPTYHSRLGLARLLVRSSASGSSEQIEALYNKVIEMAPFVHDAYIEIGEIFMRTDPLKAVDIYCKFPFGGNLSYDDAYLHGEIIRILIKGEKYKDPRLESSMIAYGKVMGFPVLEKYVVILESQAENLPMLCRVYAGINNKDVDDKELQDFFKFKYWI